MSDNICGKHALSVVIKIVATAALVLLMAGGAGAATITVDDSGGANYMVIQKR